jgi:hypothetical protein
MSPKPGGWVHLIFAVACMLMVLWALGNLGYIVSAHAGWWLMVVAWALLMVWCYAYYIVDHHRRSMRRA